MTVRDVLQNMIDPAAHASASGDVIPSPDPAPAAASNKWRWSLLLMLACGVAAAGYYVGVPVLRTETGSTASGTGVRERFGEITQTPPVAEGAAPLRASLAMEAAPAGPAALATTLPAEGKESPNVRAASNNVTPTTPAAAPIAVANERLEPKPAPRTAAATGPTDAAGGHAASERRAAVSPRKLPSITPQADDRAIAVCASASQALGLCDARTKQ